MQGRIGKRRLAYAAEITRRAGVTDPKIEAAFAAVPREDFAGAPPWRIGSGGFSASPRPSDPARLYEDVLVAIDARARHQQWPAVAARAGDRRARASRRARRSLQIGAGAGYYTAILADARRDHRAG